MKKTLFYWLTTAVLLFAIYGAGSLSINDFNGVITCPKVVGIPVCYIVLLFFVLGMLAHFTTRTWSAKAFIVLISIPGVVAFFASIAELGVQHVCPKTASGIPMCFISLGLCSVILLFKYFSLKKTSQSINAK